MDYISRKEGVVLEATPSFFSDYFWQVLSNSGFIKIYLAIQSMF